ncbi:MAG: 3-dehydroquinate synthase [Bacteroidia bacterium]|nr:3-dehydroquinate synthase [Bacteroidia bacterium]
MKVIYDKSYKVFFGENVLNHLAQTIINKAYSNVFVLVDENTEKYCLPILKPYLENFTLIKILSGEINKNLQTANIIWDNLQLHSANRNAVLLNLGGGTLSDLGGFCASTFKRGIDFINIPTTLLSMVDASIGGKQGIDLNNYKNLIGVFKHPDQIFIYPEFIKTLPNNEKSNGLAEMIKHALIDDDKLFYKIISTNQIDTEQLEKWIEKSAKIKVKIVNKDPFEKGLRKVLNFGHTIGHAVETFSLINDKEPLKHGEAVAIGIICESYLSYKSNKLSQKEFNLIVKFIFKNFNKYIPNWNHDELLKIMYNDKKNINSEINFTLLKKIGKAKIDCYFSIELILESLDFYKNFEPQNS